MPHIEHLNEFRLSLPEGARLVLKDAPTNTSHTQVLSLYIPSDNPLFNDLLPDLQGVEPLHLFTITWSRSFILSATAAGRRTTIQLQRLYKDPLSPKEITILMNRVAASYSETLTADLIIQERSS